MLDYEENVDLAEEGGQVFEDYLSVTDNLNDEGTSKEDDVHEEVDADSDEAHIDPNKTFNSFKGLKMTKEGYVEAQEELRALKARRKEAQALMQEMKEQGDLSENSAYEDVVKKLKYELNPRIDELEEKLDLAEIIEEVPTDSIQFGSYFSLKVTSVNNLTTNEYMICHVVGAAEIGIKSTGLVNVPEDSEILPHILGKYEGDFTMAGTDGEIYQYIFKCLPRDEAYAELENFTE